MFAALGQDASEAPNHVHTPHHTLCITWGFGGGQVGGGCGGGHGGQGCSRKAWYATPIVSPRIYSRGGGGRASTEVGAIARETLIAQLELRLPSGNYKYHDLILTSQSETEIVRQIRDGQIGKRYFFSR